MKKEIEYIESDFNSPEMFYLYEGLCDFTDSIDEFGMSRKTFFSFKNDKLNEQGILLEKKELLDVLKKNNISFLKESILPSSFHIFIEKSPIIHFRKWLITVDNRRLIKNKALLFNEKYFVAYLGSSKFIFSKVIHNISHESCLYSIYFSREGVSRTCSFRFSSQDSKITIYRNYKNDKLVKIDIPKINKKNKFYVNILVNITFSVGKKNIIKYKIIIDGKELYYNIRLNDLKLLKKSSDKFFNEDKILLEEGEVSEKKIITDILSKFHDQKMKTNDFSNISLGRVAKVPVLVNLSKRYQNTEVLLQYDEEQKILDVLSARDKLFIKSFKVADNVKSNWLEKNKKD